MNKSFFVDILKQLGDVEAEANFALFVKRDDKAYLKQNLCMSTKMQTCWLLNHVIKILSVVEARHGARLDLGAEILSYKHLVRKMLPLSHTSFIKHKKMVGSIELDKQTFRTIFKSKH